jgi:hypothetical protein
MRRFNAHFEGLTYGPGGQPALRLTCGEDNIPLPGQGLLACKIEADQPMRRLLFPVQYFDDGFLSDISPDPMWHLGDSLDLLGPLGSGFTPPPGSDKWLLISLGNPPDRLFPLIEAGIERSIAISLWSRKALRGLSPQVELNPTLPEALAWADYLALDLRLEELAMIRPLLGLSSTSKVSIPAQVLLAPPMPCGMGACQACALQGKQGWMLACSNGPIFPLEGLAW